MPGFSLLARARLKGSGQELAQSIDLPQLFTVVYTSLLSAPTNTEASQSQTLSKSVRYIGKREQRVENSRQFALQSAGLFNLTGVCQLKHFAH